LRNRSAHPANVADTQSVHVLLTPTDQKKVL
jgi:hypothetical protein